MTVYPVPPPAPMPVLRKHLLRWYAALAIAFSLSVVGLVGCGSADKPAHERHADSFGSAPKRQDTREEGGWTSFLTAVNRGQRAVVEDFVSSGVDVNERLPDGRTALHVVNDAGICRLLIAGGCDVGARDKSGAEPLHCTRNIDVAQVLLDAGASATARDNWGDTPLHACANYGGDARLALLLLDAGASVADRDKGGCTPLHLAEEVDLAEALIAHGADVNARTRNGFTPLLMVASLSFMNEERLPVLDVLLRHGADPNAKTSDGKTYQDILEENRAKRHPAAAD